MSPLRLRRTRPTKAFPLAATFIPALLALSTMPAAAQDGELDPSFSNDGRAIVTFVDDGVAQRVTTNDQEDLFIGGRLSSPDQWGVAKLGANGSPDLAWLGTPFDFSSEGGSDVKDLYDLRVDDTGKVWLVGWIENSPGDALPALARLRSDGALDPTFSGNGLLRMVEVPQGWDLTRIDDAKLLPDMSSVFVGQCDDCGETPAMPFVARILPNGLPDPAFSGDGFRSIHIGPPTTLSAVTVSETGSITAVGRYLDGGPVDVFLLRFNPNGTLDTFFGGGDGMGGPYEFSNLAPNDIAVDPDTRRIVTAHSAGAGFGGVAGWNLGGGVDEEFGDVETPGFLDLDLEEGVLIESVLFESGGKILAVGSINANGAQTRGYFLARAHANGTLDSSFDGNGVKRVEFDRTPNAEDSAWGITLSAGRLIAVGVSEADAMEPAQAFSVLRLENALIFTDGFERQTTGAWSD